MNEIKSINNIPIHDTVARASIAILENKINNIEDNIDLSEYVTETYAESTYAKKADIPTKTSKLTNDSGFLTDIPSEYITESELEEQNYAHKYDLPYSVGQLLNDRGYLTEADLVYKKYINETALEAKNYATKEDIEGIIKDTELENYYTKDNIDKTLEDYAFKADIPTKTSQLTNDSGFLTSIPSEYITESELEEQNYITEEEVNELLENVNTEKLAHVFLTKEEYSALTNEEKNDESKLYIITDADEVDISSYATKAYVDEAIENINLSAYALKTEMPIKVSQLTNDSNYATTSYIDNLIGDVGALLDTLNGEVI